MNDNDDTEKRDDDAGTDSQTTREQGETRAGAFGNARKKMTSVLGSMSAKSQSWWRGVKEEAKSFSVKKTRSEGDYTEKTEQPTQKEPKLASTTAVLKKEHGLADTAMLAAWAPAAVLLAPIGSALITLLIVWPSGIVHFDHGKAISLAIFLPGIVLLLFWFATVPRAEVTLRRFGLLLVVLVILMGVFGFIVAGDLAVSHFFSDHILLKLPVLGNLNK